MTLAIRPPVAPVVSFRQLVVRERHHVGEPLIGVRCVLARSVWSSGPTRTARSGPATARPAYA